MQFRHLEKDRIAVEVPVPICIAVREKAARDRQSISATTTELLCIALGHEPADFGIWPRVSPRQPSGEKPGPKKALPAGTGVDGVNLERIGHETDPVGI